MIKRAKNIEVRQAEKTEQKSRLLKNIETSGSLKITPLNFYNDTLAERISWSMPTYWRRHNIIHFAAFKNHIGLYPGAKAIENFSDRLTEYKTSKGAVQLPYSKPIPFQLIAEIAKWCYETENHH